MACFGDAQGTHDASDLLFIKLQRIDHPQIYPIFNPRTFFNGNGSCKKMCTKTFLLTSLSEMKMIKLMVFADCKSWKVSKKKQHFWLNFVWHGWKCWNLFYDGIIFHSKIVYVCSSYNAFSCIIWCIFYLQKAVNVAARINFYYEREGRPATLHFADAFWANNAALFSKCIS